MASHDNSKARLLDSEERGEFGNHDFLAATPKSTVEQSDVKPTAVYGDGRVFYASMTADEKRQCCTWRTLRWLLSAVAVVSIVLIVLIVAGVMPIGFHRQHHLGMQGPSEMRQSSEFIDDNAPMNAVGDKHGEFWKKDCKGQQGDENMSSGILQPPMNNGQQQMPNGGPSQPTGQMPMNRVQPQMPTGGQQQMPMNRVQPQMPTDGQQQMPLMPTGGQQQRPMNRGQSQLSIGDQQKMPFGNQLQMPTGDQQPPMGAMPRMPMNRGQPPMMANGQPMPMNRGLEMPSNYRPQEPRKVDQGAENAGGAANLLLAAPPMPFANGLVPLANPDDTGAGGEAAVNGVNRGFQPLQVNEETFSAVLSANEIRKIAENAMRNRPQSRN